MLLAAVFLCIVTSAVLAQGLSLGSAAAFNVLASKEIANNGSTVVQGNVGVGTGAQLTGFAAGSIKGTTHINNSVSLTALSDLSSAYTTYTQKPATRVLPATIGNELFTAGVYKMNGSVTVTGPLVLDANHDPNATFIFQVGKDLQVNANVTIALVNGAKVNNVLWLVTDNAVIGQGAYFKGNLVARQTITVQNDAAVLGRVMSINDVITLSNNILSLPTDLSVTKTRYSENPAQKYAVGDLVTFKIEVKNMGPVDDESVMVRDQLPPGLSYVSSTTTKPGTTYDPTFGLWILDVLKVGEVQTLTINARATMAGYIVNTATVAGSTVDENLNNNKSDADLCVVLSDAGQIQGPIAACAGSTNTYNIKQIAGATYTWTVPSDWVITAGNRNSSEITVKIGNTSGTISVTVNNICGASPPSRLTVEVVQTVPPKPGPISGTLELCSGKSTTYSIAPVAGATGYRWTLPADWTMVSDNGTSIVVTTDGDASTKRLSVTAYNMCGDGEPSILDITPVLKVPNTPGAISGPSAVCSTVASATYRISNVPNASSYTWTVPAGWLILSGQGTNTITVKPTAQAGDVTVKAINDCGESTAQKLTVTPVENPPLAPGAIKGADAICASTAGNVYSIDPVPNAKGYTWTVPAGWTIVTGQNTPSITVTAGTGNGKITVVALNDCGSNGSSSKDVQVTQGLPAAPVAIKGTPYGCATQTATYTIDPVAGAQSYNWVVPAGWSVVSGQGTTSITVKVGSGTGTISVNAKGTCGDGPATSLTVQPQVTLPTAPAAITGPDEACQAQTNLTYTVAPIAGVTSYTWTVPTGWTIVSGQGTTSIKVTAGSTAGNISVTATNDCGISPAKTKAVKVSTEAPVKPGAISGPATVCGGQTSITYSIAPVTGATSYEWSAPGWTITSGQGSTSVILTAGTANTTITVTAKNACGIGSSTTKQVQVTTTPPAAPTAIKGTPYGCATQTATYTIDAVSGATGYEWTVPAGWSITIGQGTTTITVKVGSGSGTISVKAKGPCGDGPATTLNVQPQVTLPTAPSAINGPSEACQGQANLTYNTEPITGVSTYNWTVPTGWTITAGQGTTSIKVTAGSTNGNISVTATNDCGTSTATIKAVSVSAGAPATPGAITGVSTICSGQANITYSIPAVDGATSYEWSAPGWTIVSGQGTTSITVTAGSANTTITVTAKNSCGVSSASTKQVQITNQLPAAPTAIKGTPYGCATQTATYTIDPVAGAQSYNWVVPAGWSVVSGQGTTSITVKVGSGTGTISVNAKGTCGDGPATSLTVQPQVTLPTAPAAITGPDEACQAQTNLTYSVAPIAGVTSYTWTVPTGWTIVSGQGTTSIKVTAGSTAGNISVTATNDCGISPAKTKAVKVSTEAPVKPGAISGPATVCGGQTSITYSIAPVTGATSYEWSAPGWTITSGQGTTSINVTAGATGTTISVIAKNACGNTSPVQLAAVITQSIPAKPGAITGTTAACAGKDQTYTVPVVPGATGYTWTVPTGWTVVAQNNNSITIKAGTTAGDISVTATNGCGTGSASTLAVTPISGAITGITGITGNVAVCISGNATFTVAAGTNVSKFTWEVPTGWSIVSGQGTTTVTVKAGATSGAIKLTASNDCGFVTVTKDVTINTTVPAAPGAITGNASGCSGSDQKYSIAPVNGAVSYTWSVPQGWTITSGQGTTSIDVKAGTTSGQVTVTATNACGNSSSASTKSITIITAAPVAGPITGTSALCGTTSGLVYSIAPVSGATTYTWAVPSGWSIVSGQGTNSITVNAGTAGGDIKVAAGNTCGSGANSTLKVTTPAPQVKPGLITGIMDACSAIPTTTYSIEPVEGATGYAWELPLGWTLVAGQGTTTITVGVTAAPGTIKVKAVNACSQSEYSTLAVQPVSVVPLKPAMISGPPEVCIGRSATYTVSEIEDASSYTWQIPANWQIIRGQGTNSITVMAGSLNGTIEVTANNGCGSSSNTTMQVRAVQLGEIGEIQDLSSPCDGLKYMVEPVQGATSYKWTLPEGWVIVAGEGTNIIMVNAGKHDGTISVMADNGICNSVSATIKSDKSKAETLINIPNVFSPNNDGTHDTWVIKSFEKFPDNDVTILNRWGTEVYKANSYQNNWTGDNLSEGTYYYVARVKLCDGTDKVLKGYVMIVR
ncbi:ice-binding family protein [Pontibacter sp. H259]|uniref:ice-binding family protein n=1 Tax=Pontibacter sp. H259 TaxID=3133421 RepID=UPI0030BF3BEA